MKETEKTNLKEMVKKGVSFTARFSKEEDLLDALKILNIEKSDILTFTSILKERGDIILNIRFGIEEETLKRCMGVTYVHNFKKNPVEVYNFSWTANKIKWWFNGEPEGFWTC